MERKTKYISEDGSTGRNEGPKEKMSPVGNMVVGREVRKGGT